MREYLHEKYASNGINYLLQLNDFSINLMKSWKMIYHIQNAFILI